jgi:hypothetical protein
LALLNPIPEEHFEKQQDLQNHYVLDQCSVIPPHEITPVNFGMTLVGREFVVEGDGHRWVEV